MPESTADTARADRSLAGWVQLDARSAEVFEDFGLDVCSDGQRTLREAADAERLPLDLILTALAALGDPVGGEAAVEPAEWDDLRPLMSHILDHHHAYVRSISPKIRAWLTRLVDVHGARHPELASIRQAFGDLVEDLTAHMLKEEHIVFPYIADLEAARVDGARTPSGPFGTILNPVRVMETDHARIGALMASVHTWSKGFTPPPDACTIFRLCYGELDRFERDLHRHVYLENHVLFPRAADVERGLM